MPINNFVAGQVLDTSSLNQLVSNINTLNTEIAKARRGARQVVQNHQAARSSYAPGVEIAVLTTSIVTEENNSQILYNLNLTYEISHDNVLVLNRRINGGAWTEIGSGNVAGSSNNGFMTFIYDNNSDSTPMSSSKAYLDTPGVPAGSTISYRVSVRGSGTIYINGTVNASTAVGYERGSSSVQLTEIVI